MKKKTKMALEDKLTELEIDRILIVDDSKENIEAAKKCFSKYNGIKVDYAYGEWMAKEMIKMEYPNDKYDLVLTDMQMEDKTSGLEVTKAAFSHQGIAGIVTGANYDAPMDAPHGPNTQLYLLSYNNSVKGKKNSPEIWNELFEKSVEYLSSNGKHLINSMKRYNKFVGKPSEKIGESTNEFYKGLSKQEK